MQRAGESPQNKSNTTQNKTPIPAVSGCLLFVICDFPHAAVGAKYKASDFTLKTPFTVLPGKKGTYLNNKFVRFIIFVYVIL